jgi:hypothetical protein
LVSQLHKLNDEYIATGDEVVFGKETYWIEFSSMHNRVIADLSFFVFSVINSKEGQSYPIKAVQMVKEKEEDKEKDAKKSVKNEKHAVSRPIGSKNKKSEKPTLSIVYFPGTVREGVFKDRFPLNTVETNCYKRIQRLWKTIKDQVSVFLRESHFTLTYNTIWQISKFPFG